MARALDAKVADEVTKLSKDGPLRLVAVSCDDDAGASAVYMRSQSNACERAGIRYRTDRLPANTRQETLHDNTAAFGRVNLMFVTDYTKGKIPRA